MHVKEDGVLCSIFTIHTGQNPAFMQTWLKLYVDMYQHQFKRMGEEYLKLKVLDFDLWCDSTKDGCKGDIMDLLGLIILWKYILWFILVTIIYGAYYLEISAMTNC